MTKGSFAFDLYAHLAKEEDGNLFFSPASIHLALAMTYPGAHGATREQIARTLHLDNGELAGAALIEELSARAKSGTYQLSIANALWGQKGYAFLPEFTAKLDKDFLCPLELVDFAQGDQAAKTINDWVSERTDGKIQELIAPGALDPVTRLVLVNAIYFKGDWEHEFDVDATEVAPFRLESGRHVKVPMMRQSDDFAYFENDDLQAVQMPYKGGKLSMLIFLPRKVDGLAALERSLTPANVDKWISDAKSEYVEIALPRFKATRQFALSRTLSAMGMTAAFDPIEADFTGMANKREIFISDLIHKADVDVDEKGTTAAAATGIVYIGMSYDTLRRFTADHPFMYMIRHNATGEIIFLGRITDPREQEDTPTRWASWLWNWATRRRQASN